MKRYSANSTQLHSRAPSGRRWKAAWLKPGAAVFLLLATLIGASRAGSVQAPYEVGTWQGFRRAAITYTFDDNCANQFALAVPMFNASGLKLTLYPVINWLAATP